MHFLSICAIAKNETPYLHEWIRHHVLAGVEHFFIYDNESKIPIKKVLANWVEQGIVTVEDFPGDCRQLPAYQHCLDQYGGTSHWIGFIDLDEFFFPMQHTDLRELLLEYENAGGLAVNWVVFGSSGCLSRPSGLQRTCYTQRFPLAFHHNILVKCIVQPAKVAKAAGVHHFHYTLGNHCVNERHEPVYGPYSPFSAEKVRLNHFFFRSQQDFCEKMQRGHADLSRDIMKYSLDDFYQQADQAMIPDDSMNTAFPLDARFMHPKYRLQHPPLNAILDFGSKKLLQHIETALADNRVDKALHLAKAYVIRDPLSQSSWLLLGVCLLRAGQNADALNALHHSIMLRETIEAFFQIFTLYVNQGEHDNALRIARYLDYRLKDTKFVKETKDYAMMLKTIQEFLA